MRRATLTLLLVLLIQCAIAVALYWPEQRNSSSIAQPIWQNTDASSIDKVQILDNSKQQLVLHKSGANWVVAGSQALPADGEKVSRLITGILAQEDRWPIASSRAAQQRFEVADDLFQRRIELFRDSTSLGTVYLGTSPGFRKVHARREDRNEIYALDFNVFDAPVNNGDWIDGKLLQVRTPLRIDADAYSVYREGGKEWRSGNGSEPDERELLALLSALRSLQISGVANETQALKLAAAEADLVMNIASLSGEISLQLYHLGAVKFIRSSEYPRFFILDNYTYDQLTSVDIQRISGHSALE